MGLINKAKAWGTGYFTARILKAAAQGEYGPRAQWVYWHMREIKTNIGLVLGFVAGFIALMDHWGFCAMALQHWAWFDCALWTSNVVKLTASVSGFFLWLGQVDGGLHLDPPK